MPNWRLPFTVGHETAGTVCAVGADVFTCGVGDRVAVYGPWGCGRCGRCERGLENHCEKRARSPGLPAGGRGLDGGMAEFMLVPSERLLLHLPPAMDPVSAAPLTHAGLTAYHAVKRSWAKLRYGSSAVVIGADLVGRLVVQALRATTTAFVVVVDGDQQALDRTGDLGADAALTPEQAPDGIRDLTRGRGADVVIDAVGSPPTLALAASVVGALGDLTLVGAAATAEASLSFGTLADEVSVQSTSWGSRQDLEEVLDLGARGLLHVQVRTCALAEAIDAIRDLPAADAGRPVVVP